MDKEAVNSNAGREQAVLSGVHAEENSADNLLVLIGTNVKAERTRLNMSRRALSEKSGVSQRFLADLEAGSGNISIGRLKTISDALSVSTQSLLSPIPSEHELEQEILSCFRSADLETRREVLALLGSWKLYRDEPSRVCLIGLRGAGKSTLGRRVSERLGIRFVELNSQIEHNAGMALGEIIGLYGNNGYRRLEAEALEEAATMEGPLILAVAGGIVAQKDTFDQLLSKFYTIWVKTSPQEHMDRVRSQGDERPMAGNPNAMDQLRSLLADRARQYARADAELETSGRPVDVSVHSLEKMISSALSLD